MSILYNSTFYISIFSSICFAASELLPFLPIKGNGILHAIIDCLSKYNKTPKEIEDENKDVRALNEKLDILISKLNTTLANKNTNTNTHIV